MAFRKIVTCNKGTVLIYVTLAFIMFGFLVGLAVDTSTAWLTRARLSSLADGAALAAVTTDLSDFDKARDRACDIAKLHDITDCGTGAGNLVKVQKVGKSDECPIAPCVQVTAKRLMNTSFLRLGALVGCTTCWNINVVATSTAAPAQLLDLVLVMDDTGSMLGDKIIAARAGAHVLLNILMPSGSTATQTALVPFRGCYRADGAFNCISTASIVALTTDATPGGPLRTGIDSLTAAGGSGTNVCSGVEQGRITLLGAGSRPTARKVMIVLTDGDNNPPGNRNFPDMPNTECDVSSPIDDESVINPIDIATKNRAAFTRSPNNVEIFVIRYANPAEPDNISVPEGDNPTDTFCNDYVGLQPPFSVGRTGENDEGDMLLGRCMASIPRNPGHYFFTPTPPEITKAFQAIAYLLVRRITA